MKFYPTVRALWLVELCSTLVALFVLGSSRAVLMAGNVLTLLVYIALTLVLYRASGESPRALRAFAYQLASTVLFALAVGCALLPDPSDTVLIFLTLSMAMGGLFGLLSQYELYWSLDERILPAGYAFPARRIRWGFYAPLLGALAAALLQSVQPEQTAALVVAQLAAQEAAQVVVLVLLYRYGRAVRAREQDLPAD